MSFEYRALVDRVFDLFDRNGLGRVLGWLVRSGETSRLKPVNKLLTEFIAGRSRGRSKTEARRIARAALIVSFAAYAESSVGPLLGDVLGASGGRAAPVFRGGARGAAQLTIYGYINNILTDA